MTDQSQIDQLMKSYFVVKDYDGRPTEYLESDGVVDVELGDVKMIKAAVKLPVVFGLVSGTFEALGIGLTTLEGFPVSCHNLYLTGNKLVNLDHCPDYLNFMFVAHNKLKNFEGSLRSAHLIDARHNPFESLDGFEKITVNEIRITWNDRLPLLKLLVAKKIVVMDKLNEPLQNINEILNRYAGQGRQGSLACAAELARAGYKGNARW